MQRAQAAEQFVKTRLQEKSWRVLEQNVECAHVQVDLLARDPRGILTVVEVKCDSVVWGFGTGKKEYREAIMTRSQLKRLKRVCAILAQFEPVQLLFARVRGRQVIWLPVDGLTP